MRSVLTPWGLQEEKCVFWKVSVGLKCVRMSRILWVWNLLSQYWLEIETSFWFFPVPWGRQLSHRVKKFDWLIDQCLTLTFLDTRRWTSHPRRPRGSQSGWEKRRDESFQVRAKEPLGTDSHRAISKNSSGYRLLIGHKKCFVLLCPTGEQFLLSSFRDSYTTAIVSITACLVHAPKKCTQSGNFQFDIKSPSDFKILSARKLKTLSKKYKLEFNYNRHSRLNRSPLPSHGKVNSHFFSLYRDYSNSLTLSNASELFWSWISINHIQVHKEKENFVIACLRPSQNVKLGIFTW